jgi:hypothetical protein
MATKCSTRGLTTRISSAQAGHRAGGVRRPPARRGGGLLAWRCRRDESFPLATLRWCCCAPHGGTGARRRAVPPGTRILHARLDEVIPFADSEALRPQQRPAARKPDRDRRRSSPCRARFPREDARGLRKGCRLASAERDRDECTHGRPELALPQGLQLGKEALAVILWPINVGRRPGAPRSRSVGPAAHHAARIAVTVGRVRGSSHSFKQPRSSASGCRWWILSSGGRAGSVTMAQQIASSDGRLPYACQKQHASAFFLGGRNEPRLLTLIRHLPLVPAIGRHQAAPVREGITKVLAGRDRLGACIDRLRRIRLRPAGSESPLREVPLGPDPSASGTESAESPCPGGML